MFQLLLSITRILISTSTSYNRILEEFLTIFLRCKVDVVKTNRPHKMRINFCEENRLQKIMWVPVLFNRRGREDGTSTSDRLCTYPVCRLLTYGWNWSRDRVG